MNAPSQPLDLSQSLEPLWQSTSVLVTHIPEDAPDGLLETIKSLEHWSRINEGCHTQKRSSERHPYQGKMLFLVDLRNNEEHESEEPYICLEVEGRDLSRGGARFIFSDEFNPCLLLDDEAAALQLRRLIKVNDLVTLGLRQPDDTMRWLDARILRFREVHGGHYELSITFAEQS